MSFKAWLQKQRKRRDPVGDFARDWCDDTDAPRVRGVHDMMEYLGSIPTMGEPVYNAARQAWREYEEKR